MIIDVKSMVEQIKDSIKSDVDTKKLLILQVGDLAESNAYIRGKQADFEEVGYKSYLMRFENEVTSDEIVTYLKANGDSYDGIILQEPADIRGDKQEILDCITDSQDVDGFKATSEHLPCTPKGIMTILENIGYGDLSGLNVGIVGRGEMVGMPLIPLVVSAGGTAICCNSKTNDMNGLLQQCDVIVAATGVADLITIDSLRTDGKDVVIIDAGISFDNKGKIRGDVSKELYDLEDVYVTSVPGGVGIMTRATLLQNTSETRSKYKI